MCYRKVYLFVFCVIGFIVTVVYAMPINARKGMELCDLIINSGTNSRVLECNVNRGQVFDYRDLRKWSANEKGGKYSVQINCNGGIVHLPWPFKAENVVALKVKNCILQGFLSEMTTKQGIADQLQSLELSNVSIDITLTEMVDLRNNLHKITSDTDCGQVTLERFVMRDIHYDLKTTPEERDGMGHLNTKPHIHAPAAASHGQGHKRCVYPNLKYIDESGSRKSGQYHLKLLPEYSVFPKLEIYNMSRNELSHVPDFFRNLQSDKFPSLKCLDFSNNFLRSFEFELPSGRVPMNLQIVDLHGNDIAAISPETTQKLKTIGSILVDLRHNPLRCSCRLIDLRQYLTSQYRKATDIRYRQRVADITCMLRSTNHGKLDRVSLLDAALDTKCQS